MDMVVAEFGATLREEPVKAEGDQAEALLAKRIRPQENFIFF